MGISHPLFFMSIYHKFSHITGIILGGGKSQRMGRDKRSLHWEGEPFLDRICRVMNRLFSEVLVVTACEDYDCSHLSVRLVTDHIPQKGSLGGLYTGIMESSNFLNFVVACDMPFLMDECIRRVCLRPTSDVSVVKITNALQPLHARYSQRCAPVVLRMLEQGDLKIQNLFSYPELRMDVMKESLFDDIDQCRQSFNNINTPADLEFARKRASGLSNSH